MWRRRKRTMRLITISAVSRDMQRSYTFTCTRARRPCKTRTLTNSVSRYTKGAELSSRNYGGSSERENMQECRGAVITHDKAHKNERSDEAMNSKVGENFAREP